MTVLIASELGKGFGHAAQVAMLARAVEATGQRAVAVVKDVPAQRGTLGYESSCAVVQAPVCKPVAPFDRVNSFADILVEAGFADAATLAPRLQAWIDLFGLLKASCLIVDHAPLALFAAHAFGLPVIAATSSFNIPPASTPFPIMSPGRPVPEFRRLAREGELLGSLASAAKSLGLCAPTSLQQPFGRLPLGLSTYAELDHYGARANASYLGVPMQSFGPIHHWPALALRIKVFVYAPWHPAINVALAAVLDAGLSVCAVLNNAPTNVFGERKNFLLMKNPVNIRTALADCDVFLNHGSMLSVTQAISLSVPTVMVPLWQEQELFARRAMALGAGLITRPEQVVAAIERVLAARGTRSDTLHRLVKKIAESDVPAAHKDFLGRAFSALP